ncbi:unnamed protein product, partial [Adineta ricciae]
PAEQQNRQNKLTRVNDCFYTLNIFPSIPPSTDEHQLHNQRISTRLFLLCLIGSLTILLVYNSLITITQTVTIPSPTITQYSQLYEQHGQILICPCSTISVDYRKFLNLGYKIHQVCYSDFVSEKWIEYLAKFSEDIGLY